MARQVEILPTLDRLVARSYDLVLDRLQTAIAQRGQATIALAGGSTPKPLYEQLAQAPLPWEQMQVFWGDERYVPPDHPESNYRMAKQAWLDLVPIPPQNIHPMPTDVPDPAQAADRYEAELRQVFQAEVGEFPSLDVILLGMGDDAHTASLFPQTPALQVADRLITVGEKAGQPRLTFTVPLINRARTVIFMVAGASKRSALQQVFATQADPLTYPSRLIQPPGELWWLLDAAAAEGLSIES